MRLSEILQKKNTPKKPEIAAVKEKEPETPEEAAKTTDISELKKQISAEKVYGEAISAAKTAFTSALAEETIKSAPLINISRKIIALITAENNDLLALCGHSTPDVYLYAHSVNVAVLSVILGSALDYTGQDMEKLCICGMLHDMGMIKVFDISAKPGRLERQEVTEIRKHSKYLPEILAKLDTTLELKESIITVCEQVHEREDGTGYPRGVSGQEINVFSKIIGIADVYEALTHQRSWRERILPHDALKKMIEMSENSFETVIVKNFIERIALYPVGSYVKLNTGEIARVITVNRGLPTRPGVRAFLDADLIRITPEKNIDLSKNSMIYITEPVDETKLNLKDKKLALELKARRWWVKGI